MSDLYRHSVEEIVGLFDTPGTRMHPDEDEPIYELVFWDKWGNAVTLRIPDHLLPHLEGVVHDAASRQEHAVSSAR